MAGNCFVIPSAVPPHFFYAYDIRGNRIVVAGFSPWPLPEDAVAKSVMPDDRAGSWMAALSMKTPSDAGPIMSAKAIGALDPDKRLYYHCFSIGIFDFDAIEKTCAKGELRGPQSWHLPFSRSAPGFEAPFNMLAHSQLTRATSAAFFSQQRHRHSVLAVQTPFETRSLDASNIVLMPSSKEGFRCNVQTLQVPGDDPRVYKFWPGILIAGPKEMPAGSIAELTVTLTQAPDFKQPYPDGTSADVYLEATAGYLPKQRVTASPGATFRVRASDLEAGDVIKIKAGFRNVPGIADWYLKVT